MKPDKDGVYQIVEEMPRFPGDEKALMEYLKSNLQMPEKYKGDDAEFRLAEYRTFIRFVVTEDGSISDVNLIKKTEGFKDLDDEALRVDDLSSIYVPLNIRYAEMGTRQDGRQTCEGLFSSSGCVQIQ